MSDMLDRRIRELYAELTEATPPLPPLPERAPAGSWLRRLPAVALAAAALVAVVATAGVLSVMNTSDDAGDIVAATTSAPTTTSAEAATTSSAPADNGDVAETTSAPGTTSLSVVDALALQCGAFAEAAKAPLGDADVSAGSYEMALETLEGELFGLRTVVVDLPGDDRVVAEGALDALATVVADARGGFASVGEEFAVIDAELTNLGSVLADIGAGECTVLADLLP